MLTTQLKIYKETKVLKTIYFKVLNKALDF